MKKHTILFLAANPTGMDPLALDREFREIKAALMQSTHRDGFKLESIAAAQPDDLLHEIIARRPTVVHFSGHGGRDATAEHPAAVGHRDVIQLGNRSGLIFVNADGHPQSVSIEAVTNTFGAVGDSVKLVVLCACYSEPLAEALLAHVDCVVGMAGSVHDDAARKFASTFYRGMAEGESVERAFAQGKCAIPLNGQQGGDCPQLKVFPGIDAGQLVLSADLWPRRPITARDAPVPGKRWEVNFNDLTKVAASEPWWWTVVLSRDEAVRYSTLMSSLTVKGDTGPRYIDSGFAYWGVGPTIQWRSTCRDELYVVMKTAIDTFCFRWTQLIEQLRPRLPSIYVSYGVGTGEKDRYVLDTLNARQAMPIYVPIDMSLDMLVQGAKRASRGVLEPNQLIPLQIDFSSAGELAVVNDVRVRMLGRRPMLFSLLGNTLANFDNDVATLNRLSELMGDDDLMVLELATTSAVDAGLARRAADEYGVIRSFDVFVRSALMQHADLPISKTEYQGAECHDGEALQIDMNYVSEDACDGILINGTLINLEARERIRLYRSRKYTHVAIERMLRRAGLTELGHFQWNEPGSPFGMYLAICRR